MPIATCPPEEELSSLLVGKLPQEQADRVERHVETCVACQTAVGTLGAPNDWLIDGLRAADPSRDTLEPGCQEALSRIRRFAPETSVARGASLAPPEEDLGTIREYRLLAKLGQGGMGAVYKAQHTKLRRIVALKVLPSDTVQTPQAVARFEREMQAVGSLDHENIVRAFDAGECDGRQYLVMEYVKGRDLGEMARALGPLPVAEACEIIRQAAVGLQHAHEAGLVHRDIKPSNLMLTDSGVVKILDLGLALLSQTSTPAAELTGTGQVMGTLEYMAPEQGGDTHNVDIRADIYSLGASLYRLLTGVAPFGDAKYNTLLKKLSALASHEPVPVEVRRPEIPAGLAAVVGRMLAKSPEKRYATPAEVAEALRPFAAGANLTQLSAPGQVDSGFAAERPASQGPKSSSFDAAFDETVRPRRVAEQGSAHAPREASSGGARRLRLLAVSGGVGAVALVLLGTIVFFWQTPQGTVRIEINDPEIEAVFDADREQTVFKGVDKKHEIRLSPGPHGLKITRGDLVFHTDKFILEKRGDVTLKIELLPGKLQVVQGDKVIGQKLIDSTPSDGALADGSPSVSTAHRELLSNPGCEEPMENGRIPGWVEVAGRWRPGGHDAVTRAYEGKVFFHTVRNPRGELAQDVDVSALAAAIDAGKQQFKFTGHVRSHEQSNPDLTRIIVEFRDAKSGKALDQYDFGLAKNVKFWKPLNDTRLAPVGTRWIRVRLISVRTHGDDNGGYFDGLSLRAVPESARERSETKFTNALGIEFALIPKGKAWLGGSGGKTGNVQLEISQDFYLGVYEVTQEEWLKVMSTNPSHFSRTGKGHSAARDIPDAVLKRFPVEGASGQEYLTFITRLNESLKEPGWVYRLPTASEWEYVCRGGPLNYKEDKEGSGFDFYFTRPMNVLPPRLANFNKITNRTCKVGSFPPNQLGLYDMHGNVWELCSGPRRQLVHQGGCWDNAAQDCRAASRYPDATVAGNYAFGLRLARVPTGKAAAESALAPDADSGNRVVDLLKLVDVNRDAVKGVWTLGSGGLASDGDVPSCRLALPYRPPAEYDFRVEFTPRGGNDILQILATGDRSFTWLMGGWGGKWDGFDSVKGHPFLPDGANIIGGPSSIKRGQRHTSVVRVRKDSISGLVDGKLVIKYETDLSDLGIPGEWKIGEGLLGLGTTFDPTVFHKIEVVEVSGPGKLLAQPK